MKTTKFFSTSIYHAPLESGRISRLAGAAVRRLTRELHREASIIRKIDDDGIAWSEKNYSSGYTSYGSWDKLHETSPTFSELEKKLNRHVATFSKSLKWDLGGGRLKMSSCWLNIMPAGAAHSLHLHPLSVVSGTYYVATPKGSSPLKFEDPRLDKFMARPPVRADAALEHQPFVTLAPAEGDVILFESWLRHEVPALNAGVRGERISVSFNYDWI